MVSGFTAAVFLLFKKLRTTFGKLLMLFSIGQAFHSISSIMLLVTTYLITVNLTMIMICYIIWFSFLQAAMITEVTTTCVMAILAYIICMYLSHKCIELKKEEL